MNLFDLIGLKAPSIVPGSTKLHLATHPGVGSEGPLEVFFDGRFESWQSWQNKKNFQRPHIVALIKLDGDKWLFAGGYNRLGRTWVEDPKPPHWSYKTEEVDELHSLAGRLVIRFKRSGRAAYLNAERWADDLVVGELLAKRMSVGEFPGYHNLVLPKPILDLVVRQSVPSWKGALTSVAGIYLITDTATGDLYVGSATGDGGIWGRWCSYASTGHGGNRDLRKVLKEKGPEHARHWQWSILEIADTHASAEEVLQRESHWKRVLCSREHGYNAN